MMETLLLIVLPVCLATSFLCAGMEAGLFALGRWRIAQQVRAGQKRAARLYRYLQNTENFLWTVVVGNTLAAFFALWLSGVALVSHFGRPAWQFFGAYAGAVVLFYTFCDLLPKLLFRLFPNRLCLFMSAPFGVLHLLLSPLVKILEGLANVLLRWTGGKVYTGHVFSNRDELRQLFQDPAQELTREERGMINRVLDWQSVSVRQVVLPFHQFPTIESGQRLEEVMIHFQDSTFDFLPVWSGEGRQRRLSGLLHLESFLYDAKITGSDPVDTKVTPAFYVEEDVRVQEAFRRLQRRGHRVAVVLGRDRRELGLVTVDEILSAILGEARAQGEAKA